MNYTGVWDERSNHGSLIGRTGYVLKCDDLCRIAFANGAMDIALIDPPSWLDTELGVLVLNERTIVRLSLAHPFRIVYNDACCTVVEHLNHFCFIERQEGLFCFFPAGAIAFKAIGFKLFCRMEESGITTLMKHCEELYVPGIATLFSSLIYEDGYALINILGKICVAFGAEEGAGSGIGIEELEVAGG